MQFVVHGRHLELTEALKAHCQTRLYDRAIRLVNDSAARMEVELADEFGDKQRSADKSCRIHLRSPGMTPIVVREVRPNMYEAIDLAADRLIEAIRRGLKKRESYSRESIKDLEPILPTPSSPTTQKLATE
jgi:ribosomal subunit interface protein